MLRVLTIGMLMTLAAAAGFYGQRFMSDPNYAEFGVIFPDPDPKFAAEFTLDRGWGCTGINVAIAFEDRFAVAMGKPSAIAVSGFKEAGVPADKYALSMTPDGKGIFILSAFQLSTGMTDAGKPIPITYQASDGSYIVANRADGLDVTTIILDLKTLKGVLSYTGLGGTGMQGRSVLVSCK